MFISILRVMPLRARSVACGVVDLRRVGGHFSQKWGSLAYRLVDYNSSASRRSGTDYVSVRSTA